MTQGFGPQEVSRALVGCRPPDVCLLQRAPQVMSLWPQVWEWPELSKFCW